jgi:hypothetical protein
MVGQFIARLFIPAHFMEKPCTFSNVLLFPRIDEAKIYGDE